MKLKSFTPVLTLCLLAFACFGSFAQAPNISYSSPQTYVAGTAITPLSPTNTGGAIPDGTGVTLATIHSPYGLAIDAAGNIYVGKSGGTTILKIPVGGGAPVDVGSGFSTPSGVGVDASGNIFVADYSNSAIKEIPAGGGAIITLGSGFNHPYGVTVDASGNIYVADTKNNAVKEIPTGGGAIITLGAGFNEPTGVAVDGAGNVYVADRGNNAIKKIPAGGGATVTLANGNGNPTGIAADAAGNVYFADTNNSVILEIPAGGGNSIAIGLGLNQVISVAKDVNGNIFIGDLGNSTVKKIAFGGYSASPALPQGLLLDKNTGIISGAPTVSSPAANYTITGYNISGNSTTTLTITVNLPPPPNISYTSPQVYTVGNVISPLSPSNSGGAVPAQTPRIISAGFNNPTGVAIDAAGNIYTAAQGSSTVTKTPAGSGTAGSIGSGFSSPTGVAVDASGNVYVTDSGHNAVKEITPGGTISTRGSGFVAPSGIAVDGSGNVFVGDFGNNTVKKIPSGGGAPIVLGSGFNQPTGVAVDAAGNVYVADYGNNAIKKIPAGGGSVTVLGVGNNGLNGVAVDAAGNVYFSDSNNTAIMKIPAGGGNPLSVGSGIGGAASVAVDATGNVYVGDKGNSAVKEIVTGGYFISPALPRGLSLDANTGGISGTPISTLSAANYVITAYNTGGSSSATVNITVNLPAAPNISYSNPQVYTVDQVINFSPANTGGTVPSETTFTYASGLPAVNAIALDASKNVYVVVQNVVKKIPVAGGDPVVVAFGFQRATGVAVDAAGNIYVADFDAGLVKKVPAGGGPMVSIGAGFAHPYGIAVDGPGNVYVADIAKTVIKKIPAGGGAVVNLGSGFNNPRGVAVDAAGNVYEADYNGGEIFKIAAGSGNITAILSVTGRPSSIAVDASGNLYYTGAFTVDVAQIPANGNPPVSIGSGLAQPSNPTPLGVAVDADGDVYIADTGNNAVKLAYPRGFYFTPVLPAGLTLDFSTGTISGTPTIKTPAKNYTITAYSIGGNSSAPLTLTINLPAKPNISYTNPQVYTINQAISPASPSNSGGAVPDQTPAYVSFAEGASGMAVDLSGNIYASDDVFSIIRMIHPGNADFTYSTRIIGAGFSKPSGLAIDAAGNVYVADRNNNAIKEIPAGNGAVITLASGLNQPAGIALDAAGNIYFNDTGNNLVKKIPAGGGAIVTVASGFNAPNAIAIDASGNIYVSDPGNNAIKEIPAGGGSIVTLASGIFNPSGIAVDGAGNVFCTTLTGNAPFIEIPKGGTAVSINSVSDYNRSVTIDAYGAIYIYGTNGGISRIAYGGYSISKPLPPGLSFDKNTGIISGTPTISSPPGDYTITAFNEGGTATTIVNIEVKPGSAGLATLTLSKGTLTPAFSTDNTSYAAAEAYATTAIRITPTASSGTATIKVNGVAVTSGSASQAISLNVGPNIITAIVTGADSSSNSYSITVTRAGSGNSTLAGLTVNSGTLSPAFSAGTSSYTLPVANAVTSISATPTASDASSTIKVNGTTVASGSASPAIPLNVGANTISVQVTANDGVTKQTYTITVTRAASTNALLSALSLNTGTLTPAFVPTTNSYAAAIGSAVTSVSVKPTAADANAAITVNGQSVASGSASKGILLNPGPNTITVAITAQDGITTNTYTISVYQGGSSNAKLSSLVLSSGTLSPAFATATNSYTALVASAVSSIKLTPTVTESHATVTVNGTAVASGSASASLPLHVGIDTINVVVTAQNGATINTYTIVVTRPTANNANLFSLTLSSGTLTPVFDKSITSYTATVSSSTTSMTVTPTSTNPNATITVNGQNVATGSASPSIPLVNGDNTITIINTSEDHSVTKTYTVVVTRPSNNASLSALSLNTGSISPAFNAATTSYTASEANTVAAIRVKPTVSELHAAITVNGVAVASGATSQAISLAVGTNTVTTVVTAQDGSTIKTYTITVNRAAASPEHADAVAVEKPTEEPWIETDGITVHQGVSPNGDGQNDVLMIDNIKAYPDNMLKIMSRNGQLVYETRGYDNSTKVFDGHSNKDGKMQQPGTYFYSLDYTVKGVIKHKTGYLVLKWRGAVPR